MPLEFELALLQLVRPGLRLHAARPWRLPHTRAIRIDAPSLELDEATVYIEHGVPELQLCEDEDGPPLRLHYPRLSGIALQHRTVYERAGFGPDETIPFPGRFLEDAHVPMCACRVQVLGFCADAIVDLLQAHGDRVEDDDFHTIDSRILRGHAVTVEFPLFTMETKERERIEPKRRDPALVGRNDRCPCGSGKKFKKCHLGRKEDAN